MPRVVHPILTALGSLTVLIPLVLIAGTALAYYSYQYAREMARRGEQLLVETTRELAEEKVTAVERLIVDADTDMFDMVDLERLQNLEREWQAVSRQVKTVERVTVLDHRYRIVPDGHVGRTGRSAEFQALFDRDIVPALRLGELAEGEHRHLHAQFEGRYYLFSYTRRSSGGRPFYIVLEADLAYLVSTIFPDYFEGVDLRRVYQIVDESGAIVFGHPFTQVPDKYLVSLRFPTTLWAWTLRMAPREAPALVAKESTRRALDAVLIGLAAVTLFVGIGAVTLAIRAERRASTLKSEFIANVSHELKTPLSLIRMFGELLATGRSRGAESSREYAEIITRESERLSRLIDNVLDFARIERGKAAYAFQIGDLGEVMSRGLDVYRYRLDREGMSLDLEMEENLPPVRIDENAMTLVLLNLVDNAVKYAADGKELSVRLTHSGDRVLLEVADRGPGIPPEEQGRIFERFYRARVQRGRQVRGSGIGLSLVKHIAEAHGGGVSVSSQVGLGSTFTVWIPVADGTHGDAPEPREAAA